MLDNFQPQVQDQSSLLHGSVFLPPFLSACPPPLCEQELHAAAQALKREFPSQVVEASGGVIPEKLSLYLSPHVDIVSLGCITQGCPVVDFSLKVSSSNLDQE